MRVSICIPTYNGARYIAEAIRSALAQSSADAELLISDSGSTDGSLEIVRRETAGTSIPVRILDTPTPGMVQNWNALILAARGDFIKFLFQDDLLHPGCVQKMLALADTDPRIGLVFCRRELLVEPSAKSSPVAQYLLKHKDLHLGLGPLRPVQPGARLLASRLLLEEPVNKIGEPSAVLFRRDLAISAGLFNEKMHQEVDWEFWLRLISNSRVGFVDETLTTFRVHDDQMSVENSRKPQDFTEGHHLLQTLAKPAVFDHLHRVARLEIYRRSTEWNAPIGVTPNSVERAHVAVREVYHGARKALRRTPAA
jgi:glycosyltransferase involved in cell wall biosynthesis